jgi:hypothetical protein
VLEVPALSLAQLSAVSGRTVETVVDPLGDREEGGIALNDKPARVDSGPPGIGKQRLQHLGDASTRPRRVDVQHRTAGERRARHLRRLFEAPHALDADQRF